MMLAVGVVCVCLFLLLRGTRDRVAYRGDGAPVVPCRSSYIMPPNVRRRLRRAMLQRCEARDDVALVAPQFAFNGKPVPACYAHVCATSRVFESPRVAMSSSAAQVTCQQRDPSGRVRLATRRCPIMLEDQTLIGDALECCTIHYAMDKLRGVA